MTFELDARLSRDCFVLGKLRFSHVLLLNNSAVPWFVLVPETSVTELCDLPENQLDLLMSETRHLSALIREGVPGSPQVEKLNVAAIGNIVRQLHVHVIGRFTGDAYWPGTVWGHPAAGYYSNSQVEAIVEHLVTHLEGFGL